MGIREKEERFTILCTMAITIVQMPIILRMPIADNSGCPRLSDNDNARVHESVGADRSLGTVVA